jgi:hypothetical protein
MNFQQENQAKQAKEAVDERYKQQKLLAPVRLQNEYNKENLKIQHGFNLEIFKKQKTLTITITIITAACSIIAGIVGAIFGYFLNFTQQQTKQETKTQTSITQPQKSIVNQKDTVQNHPARIKQSAQEESSLKGSLKKP